MKQIFQIHFHLISGLVEGRESALVILVDDLRKEERAPIDPSRSLSVVQYHRLLNLSGLLLYPGTEQFRLTMDPSILGQMQERVTY